MDKHTLAMATVENDAVIVKFYASWCQPCKRMDPIVGAYSKEHNIPVFHVNIEEASELAEAMNVMSVPTLVYFVDGEEVDRQVGAGPIQFRPIDRP